MILLQKMREYNVKYFIFSSTCAIYGNPLTLPIGEEHPKIPVNAYGRSKLMIENILYDYSQAYSLNYISLRYFNAAGADSEGEIGESHDPETHLIPLAIQAALGENDSLVVNGTDYNTPDGTCIRDYIHVTDIARAHWKALKWLLAGGASDVFNLSNGNGFSVKEVIETVEVISGRSVPITYGLRREGDSPCLVGSSDKIARLMGWQPHLTNLEDIIRTAFNWQMHNLKACDII